MNKFTQLFGVIVCLLLTSTLFAQQGSNCANAQNIPIVPFLGTANTATSGNNYNSGDACGNIYLNANEYVYSYTPTFGTACISINVTGSVNEARGLFIFEGCPDAAGAKCIAQATEINTTTQLSNIELTPAVVHYIVVSSRFASHTFNMSITTSVCAPKLPGSTCENPIAIATLPFSQTNATSCGYINDYNRGNACQSNYLEGEDIVYSYTPTSNKCISLDMPTGDSFTSLFVFNSCPNTPGAVCINEQSAIACCPSIPRLPVQSGVTYYFVVSRSPNAGANCGNFNLDIRDTTCLPPGSSCLSPVNIAGLPFTDNSATTCNLGNFINSSMACNFVYTEGEEKVYRYVSPSSQCVLVNISNVSDEGGIIVTKNCPTEINSVCLNSAYLIDTAGLSKRFSVFLEKDSIYYFVVSSSGNCVNNYTLDIIPQTPTAIGTSCANPHVINLPFVQSGLSTYCKGNNYDNSKANCTGTSLSQDGQDYVFQYTSSGNEFINIELTNTNPYVSVGLSLGCIQPGGANCIATDFSFTEDSPPKLCGVELVQAGTYYIYIDSHKPISEGTPFNIEIKVGPLPGEKCVSAFDVNAMPFSMTGVSTSCMVADYDENMGCANPYMNGEDVVFKYTATAAGCFIFKTANMSNRGGMFITDACPDDPLANCIGSVMLDRVDITQQMEMYVDIPAAGTYYIVISSPSEAELVFDFSVQSTTSGTSPVAKFSANKTFYCLGEQTNLFDLSTPCATSWMWTMPGATPNSSIECCPKVQYLNQGKFDVTLTVCNANGCNTVTKTNYIIVK